MFSPCRHGKMIISNPYNHTVVPFQKNMYRALVALVIPGMLASGGVRCLIAQGVNAIQDNKISNDTSVTPARIKSDVLITLEKKDATLREILVEIARQAKMDLSYGRAEELLSRKASVSIKSLPIREALSVATDGSGVMVVFSPDGKSLIVQRNADKPSQPATRKGRIAGRVIDSASGNGIAGVAVSVNGTSLRTVTSSNGSFVLDGVAVGEEVISFRLLGYLSSTRNVSIAEGTNASLTVRLIQTASVLSGVITTAVGTQRKIEVANDIARIDASQIMERAPVRNLTDLIEAAQVPGIVVTRSTGSPGSPTRIRMRGIGSISQNNDPVVIVDGVWINAAASTEDVVSLNRRNPVPSRLDDIDPSTIETIEIVRGPSAATLYGQDAANGVIVITTKRGKSGPTRWDFTYNRDWNEIARNKPVQYLGFGTGKFSTEPIECRVSDVAFGLCTQDSVAVIDRNSPFVMDEGKGVRSEYRLGLSGGSQQVQYSANFNLQDELGVERIAPVDRVRLRKAAIDINSRYNHPVVFKRTTLSTRLSMQPNKSMAMDMSMRVNQNDKSNRLVTLGGLYIADPRDTIMDAVSGSVDQSEGKHKTTTGDISMRVSWTPMDMLNGSANVGAERTARKDYSDERPFQCFSGVCNPVNGTMGTSFIDQSVYTVRLQMSGVAPLGSFSRYLTVRPSIGGDFRKDQSATNSIQGNQIPPNMNNIGSGVSTSGISNGTQTATAGWYLNAAIGIWERLYFDVGVRRDIGSAITQASAYPKFGTSWLISDEGFFPKFSWLSTLRLRTAFGHAAVQPNVTDIYGRYNGGQAFVNGKIVPIIDFRGLGNPDLLPERSTELEAGVDADLFNDRFTLAVTTVRKQNTNNLINRLTPPSTGSEGSRKENVARVVNRGLEMSFTGRLIDNDNALLSITTTMSMIDNQVQKLGNGVSPFGPKEARIAEGYPVSGLWRLPALGFSDINGDGVLGRDEIIRGDTAVYHGWVQPKYVGGYNASLSLLNRTVVLNASVSQKGSYTQLLSFRDAYGLQSVKAPFSEQAYGIIQESDAGSGVPLTVSEVRFQSASVTYHLPQNVVSRIRSRTASISLQGRNLALWTNYRGRDPGVNSSPASGDLLTDQGTIPQPRMFNLSFNFGF